MLLTNYATQYCDSLRPRSFDDIWDAPTATIGTIDNSLGEEKAKAVLSKLIADLVRFLNMNQLMSAEQVLDTAELIIDTPDFRIYKIDDIKHCFNLAKRGHFGKIYRIDGAVILDWLNQYWDTRCEAGARASDIEYQEAEAAFNGLAAGNIGKTIGSTAQKVSGGIFTPQGMADFMK